MEKSRFKPIVILHFVLLLVVLIINLFSAIRIIGSVQINSELFSNGVMSAIFFYGWYKIMTAVALCSCIIYILKQYSKGAALFYKIFLFLLVLASLFSVLVLICVLRDFISFPAIISIIAHVIKILVLLFLAMGKDIGKRKTWLLFVIIISMDLIIGSLSSGSDLMIFRIIGLVSRLAMDGSIGLAVYGKYMDKDNRGTV